jgi:hypothetical protein
MGISFVAVVLAVAVVAVVVVVVMMGLCGGLRFFGHAEHCRSNLIFFKGEPSLPNWSAFLQP